MYTDNESATHIKIESKLNVLLWFLQPRGNVTAKITLKIILS